MLGECTTTTIRFATRKLPTENSCDVWVSCLLTEAKELHMSTSKLPPIGVLFVERAPFVRRGQVDHPSPKTVGVI